jgi:RND family efflux transporter MFP subunit
VLLFGALLVVAGGGTDAADQKSAPVVKVCRPAALQVTDHENFTGRTHAAASADLRARVSGYLDKVTFKDGAEVKQGELLFEIDPRPYRADLDRAEAALVLSSTRLKRAEIELKRATALLPRRAVSKEEFDKVVADRDEAAAAIRVAQAEREVARLRLAFTRVAAPFDGRIGRRLVDVGNLVKADDTHLATLVARDPMYVYFDIDERTALRLRRTARQGRPRAAELPVAVGLADEKGFPRRGTIDFADNRVSPTTGQLRLRAVLPNKDGLLMPGLFVRVRLALGESYRALLVPEGAVLADQGEKFVLVVNEKNVVERRRLEVGSRRANWRVVKKGLQAGDWVILGGQQALRPGMTVQPRPEVVPGPEVNKD